MRNLFDCVGATAHPEPREPLNVVLFAGGGGADVGIEAAGFPVHVAINHDPEAVAMHKANFPECRHFTQNVWNVSPLWATQGHPVRILWASPDCKHFSRAKGSALLDRNVRDLAWVVVKWAEEVRPEYIFLENVPEFLTWCDLVPAFDTKGRPKLHRKTGKQLMVPDRRQIDENGLGNNFKAWARRLRRAGYSLDHRELAACDYGTPTTRQRLFMVARRDRMPISWPKPTHAPAWAPQALSGEQESHASAASCIDWSLPCPSIFEREKPLREKSMLRIARGLSKFVLNIQEPFIVDSSGVRALHATHVVRQFGTSTGSDPRRPLGTVTAGGGAKTGLCMAHISKFRGTNVGTRVHEPLHTISAGGRHHGLVLAHALKYYSTNIGFAMDRPTHAVTTKHRHGLVTSSTEGPHTAEIHELLCWARRHPWQWPAGQVDEWGELLADAFEGQLIYRGEVYAIADVGFRMWQPRELARAQGFDDSFILDPELNGRPISKRAQIKMIGNSVPPQFPEALIRCNITRESMAVA